MVRVFGTFAFGQQELSALIVPLKNHTINQFLETIDESDSFFSILLKVILLKVIDTGFGFCYVAPQPRSRSAPADKCNDSMRHHCNHRAHT